MRVLLIDDNEDFTTMLSEFLQGKDVECESINDPRKGLERIKNEHFDAVLLDNHMPGFYGIDLIEKLENEKILEDQKIILLSGFDFSGQEIDELLEKDGVKMILRKPTPLKELFAAILN